MNVQALISARVVEAAAAVNLPLVFDPQLKPSSQETFGDYQVNGIMTAAKEASMAPRQLAALVVKNLQLEGIAEKVEVAGPGFINIFLDPHWLAEQIDLLLEDPRLGVQPEEPQQTVVVDYSGPNVAKEMAVHHMRSTLIGDAMVRTLQFLGHNVIRVNHIGDWGTQFGMLIAHLGDVEAISQNLADLEQFYQEAKRRYDSDSLFAARAREAVVKLQQGEPAHLKLWRKLVQMTMSQNQKIYQRLNVLLTPEDVMGESLYNPMLPEIVADLEAKGLAVESDGAKVVFLPELENRELKNKQGEPMGVIIQKSDGAFLYSTTDIACAKYRYERFGADRILYYVDSRQQQHLAQSWSIARLAGYIPAHVSLEHHHFGMMLGKNGKPFKTRSGGNVKLTDLLDEALQRTLELLDQRSSTLNDEQRHKVAQVVSIGAIKYSDLSRNRTTDYLFDWEKMLSLEGNTSPYLQYAYSRICAIFRRAECPMAAPPDGRLFLTESVERSLAVKLLQFPETLCQVARDGTPHLTCHYLYELAGLFSRFYESCPILSSHDEALRSSRLRVAALTARVIRLGLETLGIQTVERM